MAVNFINVTYKDNMQNFKFEFKLNDTVVSFFDARNKMIDVYKNRGFSEKESKYFFAECLRDDSIGELKRLQLKQHDITIVMHSI